MVCMGYGPITPQASREHWLVGQRSQEGCRRSPLRETDDTFHREQLHPDPLLSECLRSASEVSHLLAQATPEDGAAPPSCLASTAPVTEGSFVLSPQLTVSQPALAISHRPSPPSPSVLSPNHFAPLENLLSPTPLGDFLILEPKPPSSPELFLDPTPPYTVASLTLPTKEVQDSEAVSPLEATRSLVSRPGEVSVNVPITTRTGSERQPAPDLLQQRPAADEPLSSDSAQSFNHPLPDPHASQAPLWGDRLESGNFLPPDADALAQLKRQDREGGDFRTANDQKSKESFIKSPHSLEKLSSAEPSANPQALAASHLASGKGKHMYQHAPHSKTSGDDAETKPTQLFWGPPSLHSEALRPTTPAERDRSPTPVYFNSMAEVSMAITFPTAPLVTESQPQTWLQTQSRSHSQADPPTESQAQPQPHIPVLVLTHSPQSQLQVCGVQFHRTREAQGLGPSETQRLEYNILKKEQEKVWGLPTVVQKSQDTFCPPPPKPSLVSRSFKSQTPRPILLGDFPLTNELRKKLEHHLRKRLIQHRWGLPHRINESMSLMYPQSGLMEPLEPGKSRGLSWISHFKHSMKSYATVLSGSGKSRNRTSESHPLAGTEAKAKKYSQDTGQEDHPQSNFREAPRNSLASALKTDQECLAGSRSDQLSSLSLVSQCQKRIKDALEKHFHKKTQEIREGQMPSTVEKSWLSINMPPPPPETTPGRLKDLAPLAGEEDALIKHQRGLSLSHSKENILEVHIKTLSRRMTFGLPQRVEESLVSCMTHAEQSHNFSQFYIRPHTLAGVDCGQSSRFMQRHPSGDGMRTMKAIPTRGARLSASSPTSKIEPVSENKKGFVDRDLSIAQSGREPIQSRTPCTVDKSSLQQSGSDSRPSPELPVRPDGPTDEALASSTKTRGPQGQRTGWKDGPMTEGSTELLKGQKLPGLHPQSPKILTVPQGMCSPGSHRNPCQAMQGMSILHNPETSDSKSQVLPSKSRLHIQATGLPHVSSASEEMTSKRQGPSSGDRAASQVMRVHLPTVRVSMELGHGPWFPPHVSGKCQSQTCPPAAKGVSPLAAESGRLGGGDASLGTSQTRGKRLSAQARAPKETHGHTSSLALPPEGQPPENQFTNQVKCYWQWKSPGRKHKGQERSLTKGSSSSPSVKSKGLVKERCEFFGNIEAQSCVRDPGVILRKQLGHRHGAVIPCPQATGPPLTGSEDTRQAQTGPVQRHHSRGQAAHSQVQRVGSCSPGRGQTTPKKCGIAGKAEVVETSPIRASQGTRVPPKSSL